MRPWFLLPLLVGFNSLACSETDTVADTPLDGAGQAGQAASSAGGGGGVGGGTATDPPLQGGAGTSAGSASSDAAGAAGDDGGVTSITTSPLALYPAFSTIITDYYVRCADGDNALTVTTSTASGDTTRDVTLQPNDATNVDDRYFIRCLPADFPAMTVTTRGTPTAGYYLANSNNYAMVLDTHGVPVWYARGTSMINVDTPAVDTISLMPNFAPPFGAGSVSNFEIRSLATDLVTVVSAAAGAQTDAHEFRTLPNGDHLLFTTPAQTGVDLTGLNALGNNETIMGCIIQEIDASNNLVWSWDATDHVDPVLESLEPLAVTVGDVSVTDVFHCNSIEVDGSGNLLLSMRHANALFYIDRTTDKVTWKLGGSAYNKDGAALIHVENDAQTTFSMQHDARFRANGNVTLFDDHGAGKGVARGIEYALDHDTGVATPVFQTLGSAAAGYEGSFRRYDDGESVVGWGFVNGDPRFLTEVDAQGNDVLDMAFDDAEVNYRSVKVPTSQFDLATLRASAGK